MEQPQTLGISVGETIKTKETFGKPSDPRQAGIGGTLQMTDMSQSQSICEVAFDLSRKTNLPVVIIVRA